MARYRVVVDDLVLEVFHAQRMRSRQWLLDLFERLAEAPHSAGDYQVRDKTGRDHEVKIFGRWQVTFWCDAPVKELRIVRLDKLPFASRVRRKR